MTLNSERILITGGTGLIGRNLAMRLEALSCQVRAVGSDWDLRDQATVERLFGEVRPTFVFHLAARVGGIFANSTLKPDFYRDNVLINTHVVDQCVRSGVTYVFAMGTGCAYPKRLEGEVLHEEDYLDGTPEPTNDAYAYAKRGMLVHLQGLRDDGDLEYCYCLPANIYGPHDNFHPTHSHVVPGLIRRFVDHVDEGLDTVEVWGDGTARRDFLYIDDCVAAMVDLAEARFSGPVNVATGELTSIRELAEAIGRAAGFEGTIRFDEEMPTGQTQRVFDTSRIRDFGWNPVISLEVGLERTVAWFRAHRDQIRER